MTVFGDPGTQIGDETSFLTRSDRGVHARLSTSDLTPGNPYTLWMVVFNDPSDCDNPPECAFPGDRFHSAEVSAHFMDGKVAGRNGTANFAGSLKINDLRNELLGHTEDAAFTDAMKAQFLLIIRDHGPKISGEVNEQIGTFLGGCNHPGDGSVAFPAPPVTDKNTCALTQMSLHVPIP